MEYKKIFTIEPDKRSGKPCIRGMRITVYDVLDYLASGMTEDEILEDFDELTKDVEGATMTHKGKQLKDLKENPPEKFSQK